MSTLRLAWREISQPIYRTQRSRAAWSMRDWCMVVDLTSGHNLYVGLVPHTHFAELEDNLFQGF